MCLVASEWGFFVYSVVHALNIYAVKKQVGSGGIRKEKKKQKTKVLEKGKMNV